MSLVEFVLEVHDHLEAGELSHAFGGALALAYVADPRGTADVDVNVFTPVADVDPVIEWMTRIDLHPDRDRSEWFPAAGIRLRRQGSPWPVDLFPSLDDRYEQVERRRVVHPFGPDERPLPFLSAEDLVVFKLSFGRDRDWVDLRAIATARPDLDLDYVEDQVLALRGPHLYPRLVRLRTLLRAQS